MDRPTRHLDPSDVDPPAEHLTQRLEDENADRERPPCPKCHGGMIWVKARTTDANSSGSGHLFLERLKRPFWGHEGISACAAQVCVVCGYTELYALDPHNLLPPRPKQRGTPGTS